nr:glutathione binding-like protein [Jannaschia sp. Os4]
MHFSYLAPETVPYGIARYEAEGARLHGVLDAMLDGRDWLLDWGYSVVDIAVFGWVMLADRIGAVDGAAHPNLRAWIDRMVARPAVRKGLTVPDRVDPSRLPPHKLAADG